MAAPEIRIHDDPAALARAAAEGVVELGARAIEERGVFTVALSGGATPRALYERLAAPGMRGRLDWGRVRVFFGDERAVPPDHPDSNFRMAWETWLRDSPIPRESIHRMEGEADDLAGAAVRYAELLAREAPADAQGFPVLDLVLLGLGEDGHTASLFPGTDALAERWRPVVANYVPRLAAWRLTLTLPAINAARVVWFLATGAAKAPRVAQALGRAPGGESLPAGCVRPVNGALAWWLDRSAAAKIADE